MSIFFPKKVPLWHFLSENAKNLGINLGELEYGVLSHAHYDHADGMPAFFDKNESAKFYLRKGTGENCYGKKNFFQYKYNGIARGTLNTYEDRIEYVEGDYEITKGIYLIPHKTRGLERIAKKVQLYVKENGKMFADDFAHEQSLVFDTPKGLVVFNSCSHGGADNIITEIIEISFKHTADSNSFRSQTSPVIRIMSIRSRTIRQLQRRGLGVKAS